MAARCAAGTGRRWHPANLAAFLPLLAMLAMASEVAAARLTLTWVDASADELGFSIERSIGGEDAFAEFTTTGPGVTTYTDTTAAGATTYCYRVRAFNAAAYSDYSFPACATTAPHAVSLALATNQPAFRLGDLFHLDVSVTDGGSAAMADVYVGSVLPPSAGPAHGCRDGDAVTYLVDPPARLDGLVVACATGEGLTSVPLYQAVSVEDLPGLMGRPDFFTFDWPQATPGDYAIFMIVVEAGTANVIAQGTVTVHYTP